MTPNSNSDILTVKLNGTVTLGHLQEVAKSVLGLVTEVSGAIVGPDAANAYRWEIVGTVYGSLTLKTRPQPVEPGMDPEQAKSIVGATVEGMKSLREGRRPETFTDAALDRAQDLVDAIDEQLTGITLSLGEQTDGVEVVSLDNSLISQLEVALGHVESFGTVEGYLEDVLSHRDKYFNVYDFISGRRYECRYADRIPLEQIVEAFGKRVAVRGFIRAKRGGKVTIHAQSLRVFPEADEIPSAESVLGLLKEGGD